MEELQKSEAIEEIIKYSGSQFDPLIVDVMVNKVFGVIEQEV